MKNCLKTEFKTLIHLKPIWLCICVLLIITMFFCFNSFNSASSSLEYSKSIYTQIHADAPEDAIIDDSDILKEVKEIYSTYNINMSINNSLGLLIGIGLLVIPVLASFYFGSDYNRSRVIKAKITYYSLTKIYLSKLIVFILSLILILFLYLLLSISVSTICWNTMLKDLFDSFKTTYPINSHFISDDLKTILLTLFILSFYAILCALITVILKHTLYGIIGMVVLNYLVLPFNFTPHNIFYCLISKTIYVSSVSPFMFNTSVKDPLSTNLNIFLLCIYFIAFLLALFVISRLQKNS